MHYYIYPAGGGGNCIAWLIEFFNCKEGSQITYSFLDDSDAQRSLEYCYKEIKDCEVLIASNRLYEKLADKLVAVGIKNFSNGIEMFAKKLNAHLSNGKNVGLICDDYSSQKHFGKIEEELKNRGFRVFSLKLFGSYEYFADLASANELLITNDFLSYLTFCPLMIGTTLHYTLHREVKYLNIPSSYYIPNFHSYYHTREHLARILAHYEVASFINHYIVCSNKRSYESFAEFFDKNNGYKERLLKFGYPSFDKEMQLYKKQQECVKDTIIVPAVVSNVLLRDIAESLINALLDKTSYRIVYKTHNGHPELFEQEKQFCAQWLDRENFVFYTEANLTPQELKRSLTLIESRSSLLYTYPLITGKASILLQPDSKFLESSEDNFYEERLHLKALCVEDVLEMIECLSDAQFCAKRQEMIEHYRKNDAYCFGESSKAIAQFVEECFKKFLL